MTDLEKRSKYLRLVTNQLLPPYSALKIANYMGCVVYSTIYDEKDGKNIYGSIIILDYKPTIYINRKLKLKEINFTIAHELGILLTSEANELSEEFIDNKNLRNSILWNKREIVTSIFAINLLVPKNMLRRAIHSGAKTFKELSLLFNVPENIIEYQVNAI